MIRKHRFEPDLKPIIKIVKNKLKYGNENIAKKFEIPITQITFSKMATDHVLLEMILDTEKVPCGTRKNLKLRFAECRRTKRLSWKEVRGGQTGL